MFETCEYITSSVKKEQFPNKDNLPEFVFLGRSNVGKSSLLNAIVNRKMLAKISSKPGKTQTINFFKIDNSFYFVDVPGYGYANKSIETRQNFGSYIEEYLTNNTNLKIAFLLVDTKVGPTNDDILMFEYLSYHNLNVVVISTKCDKIGKTLLPKSEKNILTKLSIKKDKLITVSSVSRIRINEIIEMIKNHI